MRAPPRSSLSSMRATSERAIWSISVSPEARDSKSRDGEASVLLI